MTTVLYKKKCMLYLRRGFLNVHWKGTMETILTHNASLGKMMLP